MGCARPDSRRNDHDPPSLRRREVHQLRLRPTDRHLAIGGSSSPGDGNYLRVADWDEATTEGGSSGGCLFDSVHSNVASAPCPAVSPRAATDEPDWYGRLAAHWTGDGTPETRLSDWLDPIDSGALFLDGKNGTGVGSEEVWLIPAVASRPGVAPTDWKSQVAVVNPTSETRSASVYSVTDGQAWPGELLSGPHTIEANESLYVDDVLQPERPASGLIYVTVNGTGTAVSCRTFTPSAQGGTFGQGQPGILLSSASSRNRTHPAVDSLGTRRLPYQCRLRADVDRHLPGEGRDLLCGGHPVGAKDVTRRRAAWRQVNDIFNNMGIGDAEVEGGWIRVRLVSGSPSFWTTYATVIDDTTGDPTYVLPVAP